MSILYFKNLQLRIHKVLNKIFFVKAQGSAYFVQFTDMHMRKASVLVYNIMT